MQASPILYAMEPLLHAYSYNAWRRLTPTFSGQTPIYIVDALKLTEPYQ